MRNRVLVIVGSILLLGGKAASASPNYPPELRKALELSAEPACDICHQDNNGGDRTVTQRFGKAMQRSGAFGDNDLASLRRAITLSEQDQLDSDRDGVGDIDELREGFDPNRIDHEPPTKPASGTGSGGTQGELPGASGGSEPTGGALAEPGLPPAESALEVDFPTRETGCAMHGARARRESSLGWSGFGLVAWFFWRWRTKSSRPRSFLGS